MLHFLNRLHDTLNITRSMDWLGPLALRLYLAPVMIAAGLTKYATFDSVVSWFGNEEWGLGLPFPVLMAFLATATELVGGVMLLVGLATRYVAVPLMITMLVAMFAVHWQHGWFAIAPTDPQTSMAKPLAAVGFPGAQESLENSAQAGERLARAQEILKRHGRYEWLSGKGNFVILNNGIEFSATYFMMLLMLFFVGAGRFFSLDYWLYESFRDVQED